MHVQGLLVLSDILETLIISRTAQHGLNSELIFLNSQKPCTL